MMRAEEKAARLPAIMTIPLILFILPVLFIVILGPAACSISDAMMIATVITDIVTMKGGPIIVALFVRRTLLLSNVRQQMRLILDEHLADKLGQFDLRSARIHDLLFHHLCSPA